MEVHVFKSQNLWFDPSAYVNTDTVAVYIDEDNPRKCCMDISFLPKLAS